MNDDRPFSPEPRGPERHRSYRSAFWPIVLIAVGVIWLLVNLGMLPEANLWILLRLWPLALIAIGLDILVGRRWPALGALVGLGIVALVVALLLFGPRLGVPTEGQPGWLGMPVIHLGDNSNVQTDNYNAPLGNATSARVELHLHEGRSTVSDLSGSQDLIQARLTHLGQIIFQVSGDRQKTVVLDQQQGDEIVRWLASADLPWDIRLNPSIPLDLQISGGSGSATLELSKLSLSALDVSGGSGSMTLMMPGGDNYKARLSGGSGSFRVDVPENAAIDLTANLGSGSYNMDVAEGAQLSADLTCGSGSTSVNIPANAPVHIEVRRHGSGSIHLPSALKRVSGSGDTGVWEMGGFSDNGKGITLVLSGGSGSISVR